MFRGRANINTEEEGAGLELYQEFRGEFRITAPEPAERSPYKFWGSLIMVKSVPSLTATLTVTEGKRLTLIIPEKGDNDEFLFSGHRNRMETCL